MEKIKKILSFLYQPFSFLIPAAFLIFIIFPISILVLPFNWSFRLKVTAPFWQFYGKLTIYIACLCKVHFEDYRPKEVQSLHNPPGLYVGNHQSFIDIPLMLCTCQIAPIMKKEILYIPVFGICAYSSGAMIVNRKRGESRRKVFKQAQERLFSYYKNLQYYPEGTRNKGNKPPRDLDKIKKPLMVFAYKNNVPVCPFSMYGTTEVLSPKGFIQHGRKVGKIMHAPIFPKDFENEDEFVKAVWDKVTLGYFDLKEKLS